MNTSKNKNWPYHLYEGSKPELQGSYVPCANNPCSEHGGSEVYATSPEDAYTKAHQNDTWGFTSHTNKSNYDEQHMKTCIHNNMTDEQQSSNNLAQQLMAKIYEMSSTDTELAALLSTDDTANNNANTDSNNTNNDTTNASSNASNASNANDTATNSADNNAGNVKTASNNKKPVKLNKANNGYVNSKAKELAISQNLCIDGSPLLHRLTSSEIEKYETESDGINIQKLANDVFNGVQLSNADIAGIRMRSEEVFDTATKEEKTAIHDFTSVDFSNINKALRDKDYFKKIGGPKEENELIRENINNHIRNISNVMHRKETSNVINKDTIVFRSRYCKENNKVKRGGEEKAYYNTVANSIKNGNESIITRTDFMSTTWDVPDDFVDNECCYIIKIPKGTRGLDVSHHSAHSTENELIIDKGYQFKVVGIYEFSKLSKDTINDGETRWSKHPPVIALELIP